jgi:hypothetical protein
MTTRVFAFIADGDVFMRFYISDDGLVQNTGYIAGLQSNPQVVDVTDIDLPVEQGWTYDGENFNPPVD